MFRQKDERIIIARWKTYAVVNSCSLTRIVALTSSNILRAEYSETFITNSEALIA